LRNYYYDPTWRGEDECKRRCHRRREASAMPTSRSRERRRRPELKPPTLELEPPTLELDA
jgi:hypothetical protein